VGDKLYGVDETIFIRFIGGRLNREDHRRLRMPRQALHAAGLRLAHPRSGRMLDVKAPLPEDMKNLLMG
jgi:23S rRNA-/tRNA-specific pseudouridylate synthase